jgi:hypothetical protein
MGFIFYKYTWMFIPLCLATLLTACQPGLPSMKNITPAVPSGALDPSYSGTNSAHQTLPIRFGLTILHFTTTRGNSPFKAILATSTSRLELINAPGAVDEYRGVDLTTPATLELTSDRPWKIELLAPDSQHFPILHVPGIYTSKVSTVILIQGKFSIAIFSAANLANLNAWAFGQGVSEPLNFKVDGDYRGRAVLPQNTAWIVVSAPGPWSVEVQLPCCEVPAGLK